MSLPVKLAENMLLTKDEFEATKGLIEEIPHARCRAAAQESYWWPHRDAQGGAVIKPNSVFWLYFWAETGLGSAMARDAARRVLCKVFGYGWDEAEYNGFFALFDAALVSTGRDFRIRGTKNNPERDALRPCICTDHCHCRSVFRQVLDFINAHDTPEERSSWCEKGQELAVKVTDRSGPIPAQEEQVEFADVGDTPSSSGDAMNTPTEANNVASDGTECETREGRKILNVNYRYERSRSFIKTIKSMRNHVCDICSKNPDEVYGRNPDGSYKVAIIEGHHKVPLSSYDKERIVTDKDIALLCPNCHRAVHRMMGKCKEYNSDTYAAVKEEIKALLHVGMGKR